jgi:hypothetical protein
MAIPSNNGYFNSVTEQIEPNNSDTWADLSGVTWADWVRWNRDPASPHYYTSPEIIALDAEANVSIRITGDCVGDKTFQVHASTSGLFQGEETTTTITRTDTNIPVFTGQFFRVTIIAEFNQADLNVIRGVNATATNRTFEIEFRNVDSSSLGGTISARELVLPRTISNIERIHVTPFAPDGYVALDYIANDYFETATPAYAGIVSKQASEPKITFVKDDGTYTDAIFDAVLIVQPEQYINEDGDLDVR